LLKFKIILDRNLINFEIKIDKINIYFKLRRSIIGNVFDLGSKDYTELELPAGHMGIFVSGKTQSILATSLADWLFAHGKS